MGRVEAGFGDAAYTQAVPPPSPLFDAMNRSSVARSDEAWRPVSVCARTPALDHGARTVDATTASALVRRIVRTFS
ncbi:hypothetical protein AIGOOFII_2179 [Methylobacterium marchantiae]|nr:hypothetical protein AIGOOFII_2179 [Methylobacterium marchantiae]